MKKCLSILLVLVLTLSSITVVVRAETAELSDSGASVDLADTGVDDYPYRETAPHLYYETDEWLFYKGECTSFCAWRLNNNNGVAFHNYYKGVHWGNGRNWGAAAKEIGIRVDNIPAVGAIAWWNTDNEHHVAWVAKVNADGTVFIEEYNKRIPGKDYGDHKYHTRTISASSPSGYIHIKDIGSSVTPIDLGSKFYANIVPTATNSNGLASTGANLDLVETGTTKTQEEAIAWAKSKVGKSIDTDGYPPEQPYQCVDFIKAYYEFLGTTSPGGNGKDYATNKLPSGWQRIKGAQPVKGDILVYDGNTKNPYGHVGIYESDYVSYHQNFNGQHKVCICTYKYNALSQPYWGVVRPNFSNIQYQDLGAKFYANIVPTGASGLLAVSATSANDVNLGTLDYSDYQKWLFERRSDMSYKITNVKAGKCLDIANGTMENETNIRVYTSNDTAAQRWFIVKKGNGYKFVSAKDSNYVVDIRGGTLSAGKNIQLYKSNDTKAQLFSIKKTVNHKDIGTNFYANIICSNKNFAVSSNKDENTIIYKADYSDFQKWYFERQNDKTYKITNIRTGKVLDVAGAKKENKTNVRVYTSNNTAAQRWYLVTSGSGYSLIPKSNIESALDVAGGTFANNTNVQEYKINSSEAQWFYISKTVNHKDIGASFYAKIVSSDPAFNVAANQDDNVVLQANANGDNQKWLFERQIDKTYKITNVENEKVLDVVGGFTDNYTNIRVYASNDTNAQRWYVIANGDGYSLVPKSSISSALDTDGEKLDDGTTNVHQWSIKLHDAQRVYINQSIDVEPEYIELEDDFQLYVGDTKLVTATIGPEEADQRVIWISEDPEIITIDDSGNVTAVGIGEGYISATTSNGLMTRCKVTVSKPVVSPDYITLSEDSLFLDIDQTSQISSMVYPEEANQSVIWYSEDDEIATVDEAGIVTGVGEGETIICAQTEDGSVQAYCSVYVYPPYVEPEYVEENGFGGIVNDDGTVYLFSYDGDARDIIIPSIIKGKVVSEISYYFLEYEKDYDSVTVPKTISTIGFRAFGYYVDYHDEDTVTEEKLESVLIKGYKNSAAEDYATEYGFTFVDLEATTPSEPSTQTPTQEPTQLPTQEPTQAPTQEPSNSPMLLGDVDGDGAVTIIDATCIQRHLASIPTFAFIETVADADGDGGVTILDATMIQRWLANLQSNDNIGKPIK